MSSIPDPTTRFPQAGEIWRPADDPDDCVIVTGVNGDAVFYQAPPDHARRRTVPWNNSTNRGDFTHAFIPPEAAGHGGHDTAPDLNTGTRGEYVQWIIETRIGGRPALISREPYKELVKPRLEQLRQARPELKFHAVRQTVTRTEEDW